MTTRHSDADLAALARDPLRDDAAPALTLAQAIPSGGVMLNALLYLASGPGPHPAVLLLHGLPGNEQNIDLAQTLRRAGWNVLKIHYRGSWGGPGDFSFQHCAEDAEAALAWIAASADDAALRLDPTRVVVIGHSMGGFVAAHVTAARSKSLGAAITSGVDLGLAFGHVAEAAALIDENVGVRAGLHILSGTSPAMLAHEARTRAADWHLLSYAERLRDRPLLILTSEDGFERGSDLLAEAVRTAGGERLTTAHFRTDHSYSDSRIRLQREVIGWLWQSWADRPGRKKLHAMRLRYICGIV